jgi:integrase
VIERQNWMDVERHMEYRAHINQDTPGTQSTRGSDLKLLLQWADAKLLASAPEIRPTLPEYLARQVREGRHMSQASQQSAISSARTFFTWALAAYPRRYRGVTQLWLDSLRPVRAKERYKERRAYSLEDVQALLAVDDKRLSTRRIQAAVAFLFLSGARIGAFVTLPIKAVDLERKEVRQWTDLGVRTKFSKSATTFLLDIPDLLAVVREWDARVREALPPEAMWYANLSGAGVRHVETVTEQVRGRVHTLYHDLRRLCEMAGVTYLSPHKLRHGHVMHALANSRTPADWKALSQNVMHAGLGTTDEVYGIQKEPELAERIARLGGARKQGGDDGLTQAQILEQIQELMSRLR